MEKEAQEKKKRTPTIEIKLTAEDHQRLETLRQAGRRTKSALVSEAVSWYLENQERVKNESRDSALEKRLKKMEDRLAKLQVKTAIDVGMIFMLIYRNMELGERKGIVQWAYKSAVERLRKKLSEDAIEVTERVKADDTVGSKT